MWIGFVVWLEFSMSFPHPIMSFPHPIMSFPRRRESREILKISKII
ncbi:hypothetical protein [Rickettsia endosymbiont of Ceutorhynchus obstrictus]